MLLSESSSSPSSSSPSSSLSSDDVADARPVVEVLDVTGLCAVARRSATLDGSVPVRVAQACTPFLEGNAAGLVVTLKRPITLRRAAFGFRIDDDVQVREHRARARGAVALLQARGLLHDDDVPPLQGDPVVVDGGLLHAPTLRLWTGLLVRAPAGACLRVGSSANRGDPLLRVRPSVVADDARLAPLWLTIALPSRAQLRDVDAITLRGEIAHLLALAPGLTLHSASLHEHVDVARAHLEFYDAGYFAQKQHHVVGKYRRAFTASDDTPRAHPPAPAIAHVVRAGPAPHTVVDLAASTPSTAGVGIAAVTFDNPVSWRARWDGHVVDVALHDEELRAGADEVLRCWRAACGDDVAAAHKGALLYLTKFKNLHPPGEPFFFVKPWALLRTPPGWSCVVEQPDAAAWPTGLTLLRGVVRTDVFHALPAVFHPWRPHVELALPAGAPLVTAIPVPRALLDLDVVVTDATR